MRVTGTAIRDKYAILGGHFNPYTYITQKYDPSILRVTPMLSMMTLKENTGTPKDFMEPPMDKNIYEGH